MEKKFLQEDNSESDELSGQEDLQFIFSFHYIMMKICMNKQQKLSPSDFSYKSEEIFIKSLAIIASIPENHLFLFQTKVPEYLFRYINNENCIKQECFHFAIIAFLKIANNPGLYQKIQCAEIFQWIKKITSTSTEHQGRYLEFSTILLTILLDHSNIKEDYHILEDIINFLIHDILISAKIGDFLIERVFVLLHKLLEKEGMKYVNYN